MRRVAGKVDRLEAQLERGAAGTAAAVTQTAELTRELRALRTVVEQQSKEAVPAPDAAPRSVLPESADVEVLKRELRRSADAYAALAREHRASKLEWEARERELSGESNRLKSQSGDVARLRRDHSETTAAMRALRERAEAAEKAADMLRQRLDEARRSRDGAVSVAAKREEELKVLRVDIAAARDAAEAGARALQEHAALFKRASEAEARLHSLQSHASGERDALLDEVEERGRETQAAQAQAAAAQAAADGVKAAQAAAIHEATAACSSRILELESALARAAEAAGAGAARAALSDELEAVQRELLATISEQAAQLREAREAESRAARESREASAAAEARVVAAESATAAEARARDRAERHLGRYRDLEAQLLARTGAVFFDAMDGVARRAGLYEQQPGALAAGSSEEPALVQFIGRLRHSVEADADTRAKETLAQARLQSSEAAAAVQAQLFEARALHAGVAAELADARAMLDAARRSDAAVGTLLSPILAPFRSQPQTNRNATPLPAHTTPSAAAPAAEAASRLLQVPWWKPLFDGSASSLLPRTLEGISAVRDALAASLRRQRVAEAEVLDLREELAVLRDEGDAEAVNRSLAVGEVRSAMRAAREERDRLSAELLAARDEGGAASAAAAAAQERVGRYKERVLRARGLLEAGARDAAAHQAELAQAVATAESTRLALAAMEQRWIEASALNDRLLKQLEQKDVDSVMLQAAVRRASPVGPARGRTAAALSLPAVVPQPAAEAMLPPATVSGGTPGRKNGRSQSQQRAVTRHREFSGTRNPVPPPHPPPAGPSRAPLRASPNSITPPARAAATNALHHEGEGIDSSEGSESIAGAHGFGGTANDGSSVSLSASLPALHHSSTIERIADYGVHPGAPRLRQHRSSHSHATPAAGTVDAPISVAGNRSNDGHALEAGAPKGSLLAPVEEEVSFAVSTPESRRVAPSSTAAQIVRTPSHSHVPAVSIAARTALALKSLASPEWEQQPSEEDSGNARTAARGQQSVQPAAAPPTPAAGASLLSRTAQRSRTLGGAGALFSVVYPPPLVPPQKASASDSSAAASSERSVAASSAASRRQGSSSRHRAILPVVAPSKRISEAPSQSAVNVSVSSFASSVTLSQPPGDVAVAPVPAAVRVLPISNDFIRHHHNIIGAGASLAHQLHQQTLPGGASGGVWTFVPNATTTRTGNSQAHRSSSSSPLNPATVHAGAGHRHGGGLASRRAHERINPTAR